MPRLVVVVSGTAGSTSAYPPVPAITMVDSNGNLTVGGQPFLLLQASAHSYNDWVLGGYTEAQADAMIQIAVNGGCNCFLAEINSLYPYSTAQYVGKPNSVVIPTKFPQVKWNGDDRRGTQTAQGIANFLAPYIPNPAIILWTFASEASDFDWLPNFNYIRAADPQRQVIANQLLQGVWVGNGHMYNITVFDAGSDPNLVPMKDRVWDELVNKNGVGIPYPEFVQAADPTKLWQYLRMYDRRVRGLTTSYPSSPPTASDGGAGSMSGTYQFVYTWVTGTDRGPDSTQPDSMESYASPPSVPITLSSGQVTLNGITPGPGTTDRRNVYAYKVGVSYTGQYPTSGYNLVAVIGDNTATSVAINTDWPFWSGPIAARPGYPPPTKTSLDWIPSISTTFFSPNGMNYSTATDNLIPPLNLDSCRRWYFLQVAFNCRAFDILTVWNQRGAGGNNDPVIGPMSANAQITFTSVVGDTGTCEMEGVLADGVTVYREAVTLNGTTSVSSSQTYSKLKWVGAQLNTVGPITVRQGGGPNLIIRNPVKPPSNPALVLTRGNGVYAAGSDGLPYGALQLYNDTWTAISHIASFKDVILAPGIWRRISTITPAFQPYNEAQGGVNARGIYAAKKVVAGVLYVIALNLEEAQGPSQLQALTTGNLTSGSSVITTIPSTTGWTSGMLVAGPGIPLGSTIVNVDSATQIQLNANVTRTAIAAPFYVALEKPLTGATIDCGQTINAIERVAGDSGPISFLGSVITDDFAAMAVHIYKIT